ncbi:hypothetical protein [Methylomonas sp. MgM2]
MSKSPCHHRKFVLAVAAAALLAEPAQAAVTLTSSTIRDTFVSSGEPDTGYGPYAMEIAAPTASQERTQLALLGFDTSFIKTQFDELYGANAWIVEGVSLTLFSRWPTAGVRPNNPRFNVINPGRFAFSWMSNDIWTESVTYNTLPEHLPGPSNANSLETLGTYYFFADGSDPLTWIFNLSTGLVGDILAGEEVSIFGAPADSSVGYLFVSTPPGPPPVLSIAASAAPVPLPGTVWLFVSAAGLGLFGRRKAVLAFA